MSKTTKNKAIDTSGLELYFLHCVRFSLKSEPYARFEQQPEPLTAEETDTKESDALVEYGICDAIDTQVMLFDHDRVHQGDLLIDCKNRAWKVTAVRIKRRKGHDAVTQAPCVRASSVVTCRAVAPSEDILKAKIKVLKKT